MLYLFLLIMFLLVKLLVVVLSFFKVYYFFYFKCDIFGNVLLFLNDSVLVLFVVRFSLFDVFLLENIILCFIFFMFICIFGIVWKFKKTKEYKNLMLMLMKSVGMI